MKKINPNRLSREVTGTILTILPTSPNMKGSITRYKDCGGVQKIIHVDFIFRKILDFTMRCFL